MSLIDLSSKHCESCEGIAAALTTEQVALLQPQIADWDIKNDSKMLTKSFQFKDFYQTMAFVNAVAFIANSENHHPDLAIGYNYCEINYWTHAIDGLSHNDFICAAKIDKLLD